MTAVDSLENTSDYQCGMSHLDSKQKGLFQKLKDLGRGNLSKKRKVRFYFYFSPICSFVHDSDIQDQWNERNQRRARSRRWPLFSRKKKTRHLLSTKGDGRHLLLITSSKCRSQNILNIFFSPSVRTHKLQ